MNINLTGKLKRAVGSNSKTAYDLTFLVDASDSSDTHVFVVEVGPKNILGLETDSFNRVADAADMLDYPAVRDLDKAFYRVNEIKLRVRSLFQAEQVISHMRLDVALLVDAMNYMDNSESLELIFRLNY